MPLAADKPLILGINAARRETMTTATTRFECEECGHEWDGIPGPASGHAWETCPECGADDGENCWDCGAEAVDGVGEEMCSSCRRTLCWPCTGDHSSGRDEDGGLCGATQRVL
jgi:hypothetical protein